MEPLDQTAAPASFWRRASVALDRVVAPLALFIVFYAATMAVVSAWVRGNFHVAALIASLVATAATIAIWDRGRWSLGLAGPPRVIVRDLIGGLLFAALLIGTADVIILAVTGYSHTIGNGFPIAEFAAVFIPAALHEELVFRGYPFQRLWQWHRPFALLFMSVVFTLLHAGNLAVTPLALFNIFLGGLLLSLAYAVTERLWFPIALHLGWNAMSGPILGYEVSGYAPERTVLRVGGTGPEMLTGGRFGIEGSVVMTVVEIAGIVLLWRWHRRNGGTFWNSTFASQHSTFTNA